MNDDTSLPVFAGSARPFDVAQLISPSSSAATPEPAPTGNGAIVLLVVLAQWAENSTVNDDLVLALMERALMGKAKYGTYLRAHNGRNAVNDYLQEQLDGIMYATQAYMENPSPRRAKMIDLAVSAAKLAMEE